jgi:hypothetical protein
VYVPGTTVNAAGLLDSAIPVSVTTTGPEEAPAGTTAKSNALSARCPTIGAVVPLTVT